MIINKDRKNFVLSDEVKKEMRQLFGVKSVLEWCEELEKNIEEPIKELEGNENTELKTELEKYGRKEGQLKYFYNRKKIYEEIIEYLGNYEAFDRRCIRYQPEIERYIGLNKNWTFEIVLAIIIFLLICLTRR